MKILAFETSCDETSCAVIEDGRKILSNVISTQVPIHKKFGGVVPEIASRHHIEDVLPVVLKHWKKPEPAGRISMLLLLHKGRGWWVLFWWA